MQVVQRVSGCRHNVQRQFDAFCGPLAEQVERRRSGRGRLTGRRLPSSGGDRLTGRGQRDCDGGRGLARTGQEAERNVQRQRTQQAAGEQRGRVHRCPQRVRGTDHRQERAERLAVGVDGQCRRLRCDVGRQAGQHPSGTHLDGEVDAAECRRGRLVEPDREQDLVAQE